MRLTAKGQRWLHRWRVAQHVAGWAAIIVACLALFGWAANETMAPHYAKFH